MRKFIITVNGKSYEVEVDEITGRQAGVPSLNTQIPVPAATPSSPEKPMEKQPEESSTPKLSNGSIPEDAIIVNAPMPGTILDIKVSVGDSVTKGQVLFILEAMKMENEIMAPENAEVVSIQVSKGASVNAGDVLIALK
jgi:biotin carboxyl carrier protein